MAHDLLAITDRDRAALSKLTVSLRTPRGQSTRAHIVLACAEGTVAKAARRCGVSFRTAAKWKQRYERCGIAGLADAPRTGRPAATGEMVHRALTCVLREPPARGWTTRSIADATGLSQSTVCRIRRDHFPKSAIETGQELAEQSAILAFVYVGPGRRMLAFHSPPTAPDRHRRRQSTTRKIADAVETVLCAALVPVTATPPSGSATTIELLRRATGDIPSSRSVTVALDFEPDNMAKHWLLRNPHIDVVVVPREHWLGQLHALAEGVDARQLLELDDLQRRIRDWYVGPERVFEWSRSARSFDSDVDGGSLSAVSGANGSRPSRPWSSVRFTTPSPMEHCMRAESSASGHLPRVCNCPRARCPTPCANSPRTDWSTRTTPAASSCPPRPNVMSSKPTPPGGFSAPPSFVGWPPAHTRYPRRSTMSSTNSSGV